MSQLKWEELKVYRPLPKEALTPAFKHFTAIIAENLLPYGFKKVGRRLIRPSKDLLQVIHIDTRGSWMGRNESFETEIGLATVYDTDCFVKNHELTGSKKIERLIPGLKNYGRITQEYKVFAEFYTRTLIEYILPYFRRYSSSTDVLTNRAQFKVGEVSGRNENLILFCELAQHMNQEASAILSRKLVLARNRSCSDAAIQEVERINQYLHANQWDQIDQILLDYKSQVVKKLKLKTQGD